MNKFSLSQVSFVVAVVVFFAIANCQAYICPDQHSSCRVGQTCCRTEGGGYGCCAYANASCCSDGRHCCPQGTQCDLSGARCRRSSQHVKLVPATYFEDIMAELDVETDMENEIETNAETFNTTLTRANDICPDQRSSCPSDFTCCAMEEGGYGCCPLPNATCCADGVHCCPNGRMCSNSGCI